MASLREKILSAPNFRFEMFESPHWKDEEGKPLKLKIRSMPYGRRAELVAEYYDVAKNRFDMKNMVPKMIIETFVDPLNDKLIFEPADNDMILGLSPEAIDAARDVMWRVTGLSGEEIEKNSEGTETK